MSTHSPKKKLSGRKLAVRITAWVLSILMVGSTAAAIITTLLQQA